MVNSIVSFFSKYSNLFRSILFSLLIFFIFWILALVTSRKLMPLLKKRLNEDSHPVLYQLLVGFSRPAALLLRIAGICYALLALVQWLGQDELPRSLNTIFIWLPGFLTHCLRIGAILCVTWGLVSSSDVSHLLLRNARHKLDLRISKSVSRFLSAIFNVIVVAFATVMILSEMNYDINGLIAGLGLGGLTIALAAKDSAANFFGGLVLVIEKPFEIGDWIACDGVEGTVEDISLRSTKVRTSPGSLTVVPNATLSGAPITNWSSGMEKRRTDFTLNFTHDASNQQLRGFIESVKTMLETDPDVISDSVIARFSDIGESALVLRIIYYTSVPGFADNLRVKERINFSLKDLAQKNGIEFAYPTHTVRLTEEDKKQPPS